MTVKAGMDGRRSAAPAFKTGDRPVRDVPGANAPSSDILKIWNVMLRWLLTTSSAFAKFLHSLRSLTLPAEGSTANTLWPMPLPYPALFEGPAADPAQLPFPIRALHKALNLMVAALSWLHMGRPRVAPAAMALFRPLSSQQRGVVRRLERLASEVHHAKVVKPPDMGRNAAKVEGLDELLRGLHEAAAFLPQGPYQPALRKACPFDGPLQAGHALGDPGEELGRVSCPKPVSAKPVNASRLSFPEDRPEFEPATLFPEPQRTVFEDPVSLARAPREGDEPPPQVRLQASHHEALALFEFLDRHHRLHLAPASQIRKDRTCGAFALLKDAEKDRLIIDARAANELEETHRTFCQTLGAVSALLQIELPEGKNLLLSGTDLRDYYYCFKVSKQRARRNAFRFPLTRAQAAAFRCFAEVDNGEQHWYPCLNTMAMGDNNAVELGQGAHVLLGLRAGIFSPEELLTIHSRAPRGPLACGIIIDDILFAEQVDNHAVPSGAMTEGELRLLRMCEEYLREGLTAHPRKTFRREGQAEIWGASVDGIAGTVRAAPKRLIPLMELTIKTIRGRVATVGLLEVLAGAWVSILQCRERMMCLLDEVYQAQHGRSSDTLVRLSGPLVDELWMVVILGPLAVTDLRAKTVPQVFLSDASEEFKAAVQCEISEVFARELHRHALARGTWNKLLTPWKVWCKMHGHLFAEDELPDGIPMVSHPVWVALAQCLQFKLLRRKEVRTRRHINILELESVLEVEESLARRCTDVRYLLGSDSQVTLAALLKGRSSSPRLNRALQKSLAMLLGSGLYGSYGYVPSLSNVGDDPTRHAAIRAPARSVPSWLASALLGDFSEMDSWLAELGYSPTVVAGLGFLTGEDECEVALAEHVAELRRVQKPDRMKKFFEAQQKTAPKESEALEDRLTPSFCTEEFGRVASSSHFGSSPCSDSDTVDLAVAPLPDALCTARKASSADSEKKLIRGQQEPCEGHSKTGNKRPQDLIETAPTSGEERPTAVGSGDERVAPPAGVGGLGVGIDTCSCELPGRGHRSKAMTENLRSPLLSNAAQAALQELPYQMFLLPGGRRARCAADVAGLCRRGVLDLYSGAAGVAKQLAKRFNIWVVTVDFEHGSEQDLLDLKLQERLCQLLALEVFLGLGAAPECCSFSRAVTPAVRSSAEPWGLLAST